MNPDDELRHLAELMPASGRMYVKLIDKVDQAKVIDARLPLPWEQSRPVYLNFDLWEELNRAQRDLLLLRTVCWVNAPRWFQFDLSRGLLLVGTVGTFVEVVQGDAIGIVAAGGLTALAGLQIWRNGRSSQMELAADEAAIKVAKQRGYAETDAARSLLSAIEATAKIENRFGLDFVELLRCQNLRAIAGLSGVSVPDNLRQE
jgi:Protein of unknown function (DUF3318)